LAGRRIPLAAAIVAGLAIDKVKDIFVTDYPQCPLEVCEPPAGEGSYSDQDFERLALDPRVPARVRVRLKVANEQAQEIVGRARARMPESEQREQEARLRAIVGARTSPKEGRIRALYQLAEDRGRAIAMEAPCKRGCAHCCHIGVTVSETEARLIAKASGRRVTHVPMTTFSHRQILDYENPCPFLRAGECSIYENRPLACRTQCSADVDSLLCELVPEVEIPVPYFDLTPLKAAFVAVCGNDVYADIRDFFPTL